MTNSLFLIVLTAVIIDANVAYGDYGYPALLGQFKYAASIYYNNDHECTGTIINERFILTAGHCVLHRAVKNLTVGVGFVQVINPRPETWHTVEETYLYPSYGWPLCDSPIANHDIGIIKLANPLVFGANVDSSSLATDSHPSTRNGCMLASFRREYNTTARPPYVVLSLRWVSVVVYKGNSCSKFYPNVYANQMCFHNPFMEIRPMHGDSGSPINCFGKVFGVLNSGMPGTNAPGKLLMVAPYLSWIDDVKNGRI